VLPHSASSSDDTTAGSVEGSCVTSAAKGGGCYPMFILPIKSGSVHRASLPLFSLSSSGQIRSFFHSIKCSVPMYFAHKNVE
jgi:hypothetical protein